MTADASTIHASAVLVGPKAVLIRGRSGAGKSQLTWDLLQAAAADSICPAICMTEGCDYTTEMEPDQDQGYCEACGGNTVASALILAGLI